MLELSQTDSPAPYTYSWGATYVKFDADNNLTGTPTLSVQIGTPVEYVSQDGNWVAARPGEYFKGLTKTIGNDTWFFYQHVFMFQVQIAADADYYTSYDPLPTWHGEAKGMADAVVPNINVDILLNAKLWSVVSSFKYGNATYAKSGVWTGFMSAARQTIDKIGYTADLPDGWNGIPGLWSDTNTGPLNMYLVDGSASSTTLESLQQTPGALANVPSRIYIEVSGISLQPGWWAPPGGSTTIDNVQDVSTIRFDVVTSAKYTFEQGSPNTKLLDVKDVNLGGKGWWENLSDFFANLAPNFTMLGVFILVIIVLLIIYRRAGAKE